MALAPNLLILKQAVFTARDWLQKLAQSSDLFNILELAFGSIVEQEQAQALSQSWAQGDFDHLPTLEVVSGTTLKGANGAYAASTNTIYLSQDYLEANASQPEATASVLVEEIGHYLDPLLNGGQDTFGDEGAIFSALVRGVSLDDEQFQAMRVEDDRATILVDGQWLEVEQSSESGINAAPTDLQFNPNPSNPTTYYRPGDTLKLTDAWVYDADGSNDLSFIDVWLQKPDGNWVDASDIYNFTAWSEDSRWASFDYSLNLGGYSLGTYSLWAQAYDRLGQASNTITQTFEVQNLAPTNLQFNSNPPSPTTYYRLGDTLKLTDAWVYDADGSNDLSFIDVRLQKPDGNWVDVSDIYNFTPWSEDSHWASFDYSLNLGGYGLGTYSLWAQAYDRLGQASNAITQTFEVQNLAPTNLQFNSNASTYYRPEDTLKLKDAWVYDADGSSDLSFIDVWLQKPDGNWVDLSDIYQFTPKSENSRWGSFDYSLNLSGYDTGSYTLWAQAYDQLGQASNAITQTFDVAFNYAEALQKSILFYEAQRSGDLDEETNRVKWRADSGLNDGADVGVDLTGGYYDAGDHVKFGLPMASSMTLLGWGVIEYRDAYEQSGQLPYILDAIKWGTDYIIKAHTGPNEFWGQVGLGESDHAFWGAAEIMKMERPAFKIDAENPGSDLAGEAAATLAAASIAFRPTDAAYANLLLQHAIQLFDFADTYRGKYSDSIADAAEFYESFSGYNDELVWAATWLYKATGNTTYLNKAETAYQEHFGGLGFGTQNWDDKIYGAAILLAQETGKAQYRNDVESWLDYWTVGNQEGQRITYTDGGLAWLTYWGSLRYSANTAFLAGIYSDTVNDYSDRYSDFATQQINYILGDNPSNRSYMVGFGENSPENAHHRGAQGAWNGDVNTPGDNRHILYGALVGGPTAPNDYAYTDNRLDYFANEVTLDYNAGLTGALARMYHDFGGQPLANFPTPERPSKEFFVEAAISDESDRFTIIHVQINNQSAWPARSSSDLSFRYFVDLSEVYDAGYGAKDVFVQSDFTPAGKVGGLTPWDTDDHIYYVEVDFTGIEIIPGTGTSYWEESKIRIGISENLPTSAWDPTNDWSYQNLTLGSGFSITPNIPVYEFGTDLLFGTLPTGQPVA